MPTHSKARTGMAKALDTVSLSSTLFYQALSWQIDDRRTLRRMQLCQTTPSDHDRSALSYLVDRPVRMSLYRATRASVCARNSSDGIVEEAILTTAWRRFLCVNDGSTTLAEQTKVTNELSVGNDVDCSTPTPTIRPAALRRSTIRDLQRRGLEPRLAGHFKVATIRLSTSVNVSTCTPQVWRNGIRFAEHFLLGKFTWINSYWWWNFLILPTHQPKISFTPNVSFISVTCPESPR